MEPTLPQLPSNQVDSNHNRPPGTANKEKVSQSRQSTEPNNNTLPHLNKGDGLTRHNSFLSHESREKSRPTDDYGNPLPMTPAGKQE